MMLTSFDTQGHNYTHCQDDKDIEKQFIWQSGQEVLICTNGAKNPIFQVILLFNLRVCSLASFIYQYSIRKLTVSYSNTFKRLIDIPRYTSSSLAFPMNTTDHINVLFRKSAYSMMSRVTTSPNSIISAIVNSDTYHQSPLMDKCQSMFYVCIGIIIANSVCDEWLCN